MGIRASYWATGGILAVLGLAVAKLLLGVVGGFLLVVGAFMVKAFVVGLVALLLWLVVRSARGRRVREA